MKIDEKLKNQIYEDSGINQETLMNSYQQNQTRWNEKELKSLNTMKWVMRGLWIIIILLITIKFLDYTDILYGQKENHYQPYLIQESQSSKVWDIIITQLLSVLPIFAIISTILYYSRLYFFNKKIQQNQIATSLQNIEKLLMEMNEEQKKPK